MQGNSSTGSRSTVRPATGRLGVLTPGLGAVATTFIAGVESIRRGLSKPIGSLTQMATIRLGKRTDKRVPKIHEFVPLAVAVSEHEHVDITLRGSTNVR